MRQRQAVLAELLDATLLYEAVFSSELKMQIQSAVDHGILGRVDGWAQIMWPRKRRREKERELLPVQLRAPVMEARCPPALEMQSDLAWEL
jgi:hypothetical protein